MALNDWKTLYQVSPLVLTGGVAINVPGSMISIQSLTNPNLLPPSPAQAAQAAQAAFISGLQFLTQRTVTGNSLNGLDDAFGAFNVLPGGTLCNQTAPKYPLANQIMASNAIVRDPINVSLIWDVPMRGQNAWAIKLATMQALKALLDLHNNAGGLYMIMTPAYTYDNCVLTSLSDNSRSSNSLPQNAWRFDFERPMVMTQTDVSAAQNSFIAKLTAGLPTTGTASTPPVSSQTANPALSPAPPVIAGLPSQVVAPSFLVGGPGIRQ
jgi:hypothetical protein